jgi:hypothetical protein
MRNAFVAVVVAVTLCACSATQSDRAADGAAEDRVWSADSAGIDFSLTFLARELCEFSAMRSELTQAQLDGLSSLRLQDGTGGAGCDVPLYAVTIRAKDGSTTAYTATELVCDTAPILLFADFDAWAESTPCSWQAAQR